MRKVSRAVILAGGFGTRLKELTKNTPKALVKINQVCMIDYVIHWLALGNINEFHIALHWQANQIMSYLKQKKYIDYEFLFYKEYPKPLGPVGAVRPILSNLGKDPFVLIDTDRIIMEPLISMLHTYEKLQYPEMMVMVSTCPESLEIYGNTFDVKGDQVVGIRNHKQLHDLNILNTAYCGVTIATSELWKYDPGPDIITTNLGDYLTIPWFQDQNPIYAHITSKPFF